MDDPSCLTNEVACMSVMIVTVTECVQAHKVMALSVLCSMSFGLYVT